MNLSRGKVAAGEHFGIVTGPGGRVSVWSSDQAIPAGWTPTGFAGSMADCLAEIAGQNLNQAESSDSDASAKRTLDFSFMFFGDTEGASVDAKYRLLMDASEFAEANGFSALWLPERHFTQFGCLYPDPATLHAALAMKTRRLSLRAGSVVMPLHDPVRVAESWSVVDNLSGGRVELAFASGWHADDFALMPNHYDDRGDAMMRGIADVQTLWSGESIQRINGRGDPVSLRTFPTPIQKRLPMWLTAAGNPSTFQAAGRMGHGVLTHLFNQDIDSLAENIRRYHDAMDAAGHSPDVRRVAVTLHTMVAEQMDDVRRFAKQPYCRYLKNNFGLLQQLAVSQGQTMDAESMSDNDLNSILDYLFEKFAGKRSLMGTVESCRQTCNQLADIGVTEIACLLDFGPEPSQVIGQLPKLDEVRQSFRQNSM